MMKSYLESIIKFANEGIKRDQDSCGTDDPAESFMLVIEMANHAIVHIDRGTK